MVSTFVCRYLNIDPQQDVENWISTQLKGTSRKLINLRLGEILNKLHYRDGNTRMMKRNQQIDDNGNIEADLCNHSSEKLIRGDSNIAFSCKSVA